MFASYPNVTLIEGDIMDFPIENLKLRLDEWKLVANIPYYLTGHLFRLALELWPSPSRAVLMARRESPTA